MPTCSIKLLDSEINPKTPVEALLNPRFLLECPADIAEEKQVKVQLVSVIFEGSEAKLYTLEYGQTIWLSENFEVEVTNPLLAARPQTYTRPRKIGGISIE